MTDPLQTDLELQAPLPQPVEWVELEAMSPAEALETLERFLHDPGQLTPLEPFASLLVAALERRPLALWDLYPWEGRQFLERLPQEHPECMVCPCFPVCQGYAAWRGSCAIWMALIPVLAAAARELRRARRQGP